MDSGDGGGGSSGRNSPADSPEPVPVTPFPPHSQQKTLTPSTGGREDAWSDGATSVLIDAWGERCADVGRGILRRNQWQEVADVVSSREGHAKSRKTDSQCRNRVDSLKRKYKLEKSKARPSDWRFFSQLDRLLSTSSISGHHHHPPLSAFSNPHPLPKRRRSSLPAPRPPARKPGSASSSSDGFPPDTRPSLPPANSGTTVVAEAIRQFGEAYERVEMAKLQRLEETQKHSIEFTREVDERRLRFFSETLAMFSVSKKRRQGDTGGSSGEQDLAPSDA